MNLIQTFSLSTAYVTNQHPILTSPARRGFSRLANAPPPPVARFGRLRSPTRLMTASIKLATVGEQLLVWPEETEQIAGIQYVRIAPSLASKGRNQGPAQGSSAKKRGRGGRDAKKRQKM